MRAIKTRQRRVLLALTVVVGAIGTTSVALSTTDEAARDAAIRTEKAKVRTNRAVAPPTQAQIAAMRELALGIAAANGDPSPRAVHLVPTTRASANALDTGATVNTDESVFMVSMQGNFVARGASGPSHGFEAKGSVLTFTFDPSTNVMLDMSVGPIAPNLQQLGEVIDLKP